MSKHSVSSRQQEHARPCSHTGPLWKERLLTSTSSNRGVAANEFWQRETNTFQSAEASCEEVPE